MFGVVGGRLCE